MVESSANGTPPELFRDDYEIYRERKFNELQKEKDPLLVDTEVVELLLLVLRNPDFNHHQRLREYATLAQLTMSRMCTYVKDPYQDIGIVRQAEMIHHTYGQLFAQSILELAKLAAPSPPDPP